MGDEALDLISRVRSNNASKRDRFVLHIIIVRRFVGPDPLPWRPQALAAGRDVFMAASRAAVGRPWSSIRACARSASWR
jgi:hypothetical protein